MESIRTQKEINEQIEKLKNFLEKINIEYSIKINTVTICGGKVKVFYKNPALYDEANFQIHIIKNPENVLKVIPYKDRLYFSKWDKYYLFTESIYKIDFVEVEENKLHIHF
jgi:hypothetical protein